MDCPDNKLHLIAPECALLYILLCLMPEDFICQGESAGAQCVNQTMWPVNPLSNCHLVLCELWFFNSDFGCFTAEIFGCNLQLSILILPILYFTLSNTR
jgi:hypothetical protein